MYSAKMAKRLNRKEILNRELKCLENIGQGLTKGENMDILIEEFKMTPDKAEQLYFQTTRKVAGLREASYEELKAQILCQMDVLYKRAFNEKQHLTALNILNSKARVAGLMDQGKDKNAKDVNLPSVVEVKEGNFSQESG